jgi:hypothetical protein|tara:strand:- start:2731 stop:3021 length:291 start_codon:yes stop_codon:yes gene_type:complete
MKQKTFTQLLYRHSKNTLEIENAWMVYLNLTKLFRDSDKDTVSYLEEIGSMTKEQKLKWRNSLASEGIELTPDQVDDYILILSLAITESWKSNENI